MTFVKGRQLRPCCADFQQCVSNYNHLLGGACSRALLENKASVINIPGEWPKARVSVYAEWKERVGLPSVHSTRMVCTAVAHFTRPSKMNFLIWINLIRYFREWFMCLRKAGSQSRVGLGWVWSWGPCRNAVKCRSSSGLCADTGAAGSYGENGNTCNPWQWGCSSCSGFHFFLWRCVLLARLVSSLTCQAITQLSCARQASTRPFLIPMALIIPPSFSVLSALNAGCCLQG